MKQSLQLKLSQHLTLTPQLQQSIRLLQLSTLDLNQELDRFLLENPLLERGDLEPEPTLPPVNGHLHGGEPERAAEPAAEAASTGEDWGGTESFSLDDSASYGQRDDGEEREHTPMPATTPGLQEHLLTQINLTQLSERDKQYVALLVAYLDDDGYLGTDLEEILASLPAELDVEAEDLAIALKHLQHLDTPRVGARSLSECLRLQLELMPADTPHRACALDIVSSNLEALAARDFQRLKKQLQCSDDKLKSAQRLIVSLNPRPCSRFNEAETRYVIPDVLVRKVKGKWTASLNQEAMP